MLSILIPVYNYDIRPLVRTLHQQATHTKIDFEIIVIDDASPDSKYVRCNAELSDLEVVTYHVLKQNIGRSAIRNLLAQWAKYPYLLFMDCDTMPTAADFIQQYIECLEPQTVLYGGRSYLPKPPDDATFYFHWFYGTHREQTTAQTRKAHPYRSFMTNNFLIPKAVFESIRFDESLKTYGHEDTLFGLELSKRNIPILHLDNPLLHIGLDGVEAFLSKTEQGIENLYRLYLRYPELAREVRLLAAFQKLKRWRLLPIFRFIFKYIKGTLAKNLRSKNPRLRFFDVYKLGVLSIIPSQETSQ